jgi:hypothetical protein
VKDTKLIPQAAACLISQFTKMGFRWKQLC